MASARRAPDLAPFLADLDRGALDSPLVRRWAAARSLFPGLLLAVALAARGRTKDALDALQRALDEGPRSGAGNLFAARLFAHLGAPADALAACDEALRVAPSLLPQVLDLQLEITEALAWHLEAAEILDQALREDRRPALWHAHAARFYRQRQRPDLAAAHAEQARAADPTQGGSTAADAVTPEPSPDHAARAAQDRIMSAPLEDAFAALDAVVVAQPRSPVPLTRRGELHLWLGDPDAARADFEAAVAIHPAARWAHVGLAAVHLLTGDPQRALDVSAEGVRAAGSAIDAVHVHRGEAHRLLGHHAEAIADLAHACAVQASCVSAPINLALARDATGDGDAAAAAVVALRRRAPGLLSDAARTLGIGSVDVAGEVTRGRARQVLAAALTMMRGNRSAELMTYVSPEGRLRFVPRWPPREDGEALPRLRRDVEAWARAHLARR